MQEQEIANKLLAENPTLYRNDCGVGYHGGIVKYAKRDGNIHVKKGNLIVINPRYFSYGLYPGSADYIGWKPVEITEDMVGQTVAVFHSTEIKTAGDRLSEKQRIWNRAVIRDGGLAEVWKEKKGIIICMKGEEII